MLARLSTFAFSLPLVSATFNILPLTSDWISGGSVTVQWQASSQDDPFFSMELENQIFNKQYAIANNVPTANGQITLTLPQVIQGSGYSLAFVHTNDSSSVYATSGSFSIGASSTTSGTATSTGSTSSDTSSTSTPLTTSTSSALTLSSTSASSSVASATPTTFKGSGAPPKLVGITPVAVLALSAVMGVFIFF